MPKKPTKNRRRRPRTLLDEILEALGPRHRTGAALRGIQSRRAGAEDRDVAREASRRNFSFLDRLSGATRPPPRRKQARTRTNTAAKGDRLR